MDDNKPKFEGNWACSQCNAAITQLPFEPKNTDNLTCFECYKKNKPAQQPQGERKMHEGNWKCSKCAGAITQLPFEPKSEANLTCRDCYIQAQG